MTLKQLKCKLQAKLDLVAGCSRQYIENSIPCAVCHIIVRYMRPHSYWKYIGDDIQYENKEEKHIISFQTNGRWPNSAFSSDKARFYDELPMIHEWKLRILELPSNSSSSFSIGIASKVIHKNSYFSVRMKYKSMYYNYGYGYRNNCKSFTFAIARSSYNGKTSRFVVGDIIIMELHTGKKILRFVLNGNEVAMVPDIYFDDGIVYKLAIDNYYCRTGGKIELISYEMLQENKLRRHL